MSKFTKKIKKRGDKQSTVREIVNVDFNSSIVVLEELKSFIPPLKLEALEQLESNILKDGVRDPLIFWDKGDQKILIDGHNRYGIIQKHGIQNYKTELLDFESIEEAKDWMINLQFGRRNLTKEQVCYLRGLQYNREKKRVTDTLKQGNSPLPQNDGTGTTAERLSAQHKVSKATIERDAQYAKGIEIIGKQNIVLKQEILSGISKLKKTDIQAVGSGKKKSVDLSDNKIASNPLQEEKHKHHLTKMLYHVKRLQSLGFHVNDIEELIMEKLGE